MRVLVATDVLGGLSSAEAGRALGSGWPDADVSVVPAGEAGDGFVVAAADQLGTELVTGVLGEQLVSTAVAAGTVVVAVESAAPAPTDRFTAGSGALGRAVRDALREGSRRRVVVDLTGAPAHDAGAGFLGALGALADVPLEAGVVGLSGLERLDLGPVRALLGDVELVGVVPSEQTGQLLLGLRGITARLTGDAALDRGTLLEVDAALAGFARAASPSSSDSAGAGACGGLGLAVLALGGRLVAGPRFALAEAATRRTFDGTDLVVTGCTVLDFAHRGGGVVAEAVRVATGLLCPCIAVAGEVLIGGRELRTMGVESAYAVREPWLAVGPAGATVPTAGGADVEAVELAATARRVARSWRW